MTDYNPKRFDSMEKWRKFASATMDRFPPSFLMVVFLLALTFGLDANQQIPAIDWLRERLGIGAITWKALFAFAAATIAYFRPAPKYTLLLSLPAAFLGGGILWFGVATSRDVIAMIYIFFSWLAIGIAMTAMVLYQEQLTANELLAEKVSTMQKEKEQEHATNPAAPAQS